MRRSFIFAISMVAIAVGLQACGMRPAPQESCNFVQNSDQQRVSWGAQTPVVLYIDSSVPNIYFDAIKAAAETWNAGVGREIIKIGGWTNRSQNQAPDGVNLISFEQSWDGTRTEQARTTIFWAGSRIYEADVRVNERDFNFFAGSTPEAGKVDMQSLMIHEFGHVLGLRHTEFPQSVMLPTLASASSANSTLALRRQLIEEDRKSIRCEY